MQMRKNIIGRILNQAVLKISEMFGNAVVGKNTHGRNGSCGLKITNQNTAQLFMKRQLISKVGGRQLNKKLQTNHRK